MANIKTVRPPTLFTEDYIVKLRIMHEGYQFKKQVDVKLPIFNATDEKGQHEKAGRVAKTIYPNGRIINITYV